MKVMSEATPLEAATTTTAPMSTSVPHMKEKLPNNTTADGFKAIKKIIKLC